jgi:peptide/nickel transport system substrate-binding protein
VGSLNEMRVSQLRREEIRSEMSRKTASKIGVLLASTALLAGCAAGGGAEGSGGTLYVLTIGEQFQHLDPQRNYTGADLAFAGATIARTLVTYNQAGDIVPDLATDTGRTSDGGKTWEFTLRDGVTFEDGAAITCDDVKYGMSRSFAQDVITDGPAFLVAYLDAEGYEGPYTGVGQEAYDDAFQCLDDKTMSIRLNAAIVDFNGAFTLGISSPVPAAADTGEKYDDRPVSSGPYKIETYEKGRQLVLVRNENWNPDSDPVRKAYPDEIVVEFALDAKVIDERLIASEGPDANAISYGLLTENLDRIFTDADLSGRAFNVYDPYVRYTAINTALVNCVEVRKALYYAQDTEAILTARGGIYAGEAADGAIKPNMPLDYKKVTGYDDLMPAGNPTLAMEWMDKAKTACPALYERATGAGLTYDYPANPTDEKIAAILVSSFDANAGIKLIPNPIEPGQYYGIVLDPAAQGDLNRSGWAPDWANASTVIPALFTPTGGFDLSRAAEGDSAAYAEFEALVESGKGETDRNAQGAIWAAGNQIVMDRVWILPNTFGKTQLLTGTSIGGAYFWDAYGWYNLADIYIK